MLMYFFSVFFHFGFLNIYADTNSLNCSQSIVIGCTVGCSEKMKQAIHEVASPSPNMIWVNLLKTPEKLKEVDAILSPGGKDIQPKYYLNNISQKKLRDNALSLDALKGKHTTFSSNRDAYEIQLWEEYFKNDLFYKNVPALGICYGHQMMAITHGFSLYQDIKVQLGIPARYQLEDRVEDLIGVKDGFEKSFLGHEEHHQAVRITEFIKDAHVIATSNHGKIIEAIRYENRDALSIQFHPESSEFEVKKLIFTPFLQKACQHAIDRGQNF